MSAAKPLSAKSSIGDWLNHPVGGQILREALAAGGQSESALRPVKLFSLQRVASMSKGAMTEAMVADWVARANSGEAATSAAAASDVAGAVDADAPAVELLFKALAIEHAGAQTCRKFSHDDPFSCLV